MKNSARVIIILIISPILFVLFSLIEFEPLNQVTSKYFQSFIFVLTFITVTLKPKFRKKILYLAPFLLFVMVGFYLVQKIVLANSLASMAIGILFITSLSYLPEIIKKGFVEKL